MPFSLMSVKRSFSLVDPILFPICITQIIIVTIRIVILILILIIIILTIIISLQ